MKKNFTKKVAKVNTNGGYTYEQVMANKNVSKNSKYWYKIEGTEKYLFKSKVAESWEYFDPVIENPIRNTNQIYIKFKDVSTFVAPSNYFRDHKTYTFYSEGTMGYENYWDELEEKVENGFETEGVRITGSYFFAINFGRFQVLPVDKDGNQLSKKKKWEFLRFLDHQYYMMHELEECALSGIYQTWQQYKDWFPEADREEFEDLTLQSFVLAKGRRKGWTALIAIGLLNRSFTFVESSVNILAAYEKNHYGPMLKAIHNTKNWLNKQTPWVRVTDIKGTRDNFISGINVIDENGIKVQEGYQSEVKAETFKDNPFKGIGETATIINVEEAGKFNKLIETFPVSIEPLIRDGEQKTGFAVIGGTAGDMESGGSMGLSLMIHNPDAYGCKVYENIYEEVPPLTDCGWFIDDMWYLPKRVSKKEILSLNDSDRTKELLSKIKGTHIELSDRFGNSFRYFAEMILDQKRDKTRRADSVAYQKFITQQPKYLSEAFLLDESSPFDTALAKEARGQLANAKIGAEPGTFIKGQDGKIKWKKDFSLNPVDTYPYNKDNKSGCWVMYNQRVEETFTHKDDNGKEISKQEVLPWRYIAGCDPIDWGSGESSSDGAKKHSLAASYIIDTRTRNIVAEYVGRPRTSEDYFEQLWRGLEYYNALLLYENNLKGLFSYFKMKNKLYLLAYEPNSLKDTHGYKPNNRVKGFHATAGANNYAREAIHRWSLEDVLIGQGEDGEPIYVPRMRVLPSLGLLDEIIRWNSQMNFDRVSGLGAAMILLFDRDYEIEASSANKNSTFEKGIFKRVRNKIGKNNKFKQLYRR